VRASRPQVGTADPTQRLGFIFPLRFRITKTRNDANSTKFCITDILDSLGFHGKIFRKARFHALTVFLFFISWFSFSFRVFVIQYEGQTLPSFFHRAQHKL